MGKKKFVMHWSIYVSKGNKKKTSSRISDQPNKYFLEASRVSRAMPFIYFFLSLIHGHTAYITTEKGKKKAKT